MKLRHLVDELPTKQDAHVRSLGDLYIDQCDEFDADGDLPFGADPFDILAHRQEQGDLS